MEKPEQWWADGLFFENCNCQLLCPGHISLNNRCTYERCIGYWAIHVDDGRYGRTSLSGLTAVILTEGPQRMIEGGFTQAIYIDEMADDPQRAALDQVFRGQAGGGGWEVMAGLVSTRLETRYLPIQFEDEGGRKSIRIEGILDSFIEAIKGADGKRTASLQNLRNQIHGPEHFLALGSTSFKERWLNTTTSKSHALFSNFSWKGP